VSSSIDPVLLNGNPLEASSVPADPTLQLPIVPELIELSFDAMFVRSADGRVTQWNHAAELFYGWSRSEALGQLVGTLLQTESPSTGDSIDKVLLHSGSWEGELNRTRRDGSRVVVTSRQVLIRDGSSGTIAILETDRDLTAQLRIAGAEAARLQLAAIVESSDDAIIGKTLDGTITSWNRAAERLYGYSADEVIGRPISLIIPPERRDELAEILRRLSIGERIDHYETERLAKDGRRLLVSVAVSPVRDEVGRVVAASAIARDITERGRTQAALIESEERLRTIVETANDGVWLIDPQAQTVLANTRMADLLGTTVDDLHRRTVVDFCFPEDLPQAQERIGRNLHGEREQFDFRFRRSDGSAVFVLAGTSPVHNAAGEIVGALGMFSDITEHNRAEEALRTSRDQLRAILQSAADGITVQDRSGLLLYANDVAANLSGYSSADAMLAAPRAEITQRFEILDEAGQPLNREDLPGRQALRNREPAEALLRYRVLSTGAERWSLVRAVPVLDDEGEAQFAVSTFQDMTAIKREEARVRFLSGASAILAGTLDYEETLARVAQLAVPEFADWASVDVLDADGSIHRLAVAHVDPAKIVWARELERRFPMDPQATSGVPEVIRSGEPEFYPTFPPELLEAAATDDEIRRILDELHLTSSITVPLQARGATIGAISVVYAESERHYTEQDLDFMQELAHRAAMAVDNARLYRDALAALLVRDEFLSAISHDLRTPLTTIRGLTQLMLRRLERNAVPGSEATQVPLTNVDRATEKMTKMIDSLLDLSRLESGRPLDLDRQPMDLVSLVRNVAAEHQRGTVEHRIQMQTAGDALEGAWDAARLERVLDNLLSNAIKYSPDGGTITITVGVEEGESAGLSFAVVTVTDHGIGIPTADLATIFERFRRGSNVPTRIRGAGIGLAGARSIVEQHGGILTVASEEGGGSSFTVRLPIMTQADEEK
jgi:PAS domain S-box-containing protein